MCGLRVGFFNVGAKHHERLSSAHFVTEFDAHFFDDACDGCANVGRLLGLNEAARGLGRSGQSLTTPDREGEGQRKGLAR